MAERERMSIQPYGEWKRSAKIGHHFRIRQAKRDREYAKNKIRLLKQRIKELQDNIKKPLPKMRDTSKASYLIAKEKAKQDAKERGWLWVEPSVKRKLKEVV